MYNTSLVLLKKKEIFMNQPDALDLIPQRLEDIKKVLNDTDWQLTNRDYSKQTILLQLSRGDDHLRIKMSVTPDVDQNFTATLVLSSKDSLIDMAEEYSVREKMTKRGWDPHWTSDYDGSYLSGLSLTQTGPEFAPLFAKLLSDYDRMHQVAARFIELETQRKKIIEEL